MSFRRPQRNKPDATTQQIVDELRALGYVVEYHGKADLLVTHPTWPRNTWRKLECKTPKGKAGTVRLRKDQQEQQDYCALHGFPMSLTASRRSRTCARARLCRSERNCPMTSR